MAWPDQFENVVIVRPVRNMSSGRIKIENITPTPADQSAASGTIL